MRSPTQCTHVVVHRAIGSPGRMQRQGDHHRIPAHADRGVRAAARGKARTQSRMRGSDARSGSLPCWSRASAQCHGSRGCRSAGRGAVASPCWEIGRDLAWWVPPHTEGRDRPDAKGGETPVASTRDPGGRQSESTAQWWGSGQATAAHRRGRHLTRMAVDFIRPSSRSTLVRHDLLATHRAGLSAAGRCPYCGGANSGSAYCATPCA
jgi:hypothetical protein